MTDPNQHNPQVPQPAQYGQPEYGQQAANSAYGQAPQTPNYNQTPQYGQPAYGQQAPQYAGYGQPAVPQPQGSSFFALTAPLDMPAYGCNMGEAIVRFFKKYATFKGRASRGEFWWWVLANFIITFVVNMVFTIISSATGSDGVVTFKNIVIGIWQLAVLVPTIAVAVRRLHDTNKRGTVLAIIYAVQIIATFIFIVGVVLTLGGAIDAGINGRSSSLFGGGLIMAILSGIALLAASIVYIVLMTKRSDPAGAQFDDPAAAAYAPAPAAPYAAAPAANQYAAPAASYGDVPLPTAPAPAQYAAPQAPATPQYAASQQYAAPQQHTPAVPQTPQAAAAPVMPPMPTVPTMPAVPEVPHMPETPAQFQNPYGANAVNPEQPSDPVNGTEQH